MNFAPVSRSMTYSSRRAVPVAEVMLAVIAFGSLFPASISSLTVLNFESAAHRDHLRVDREGYERREVLEPEIELLAHRRGEEGAGRHGEHHVRIAALALHVVESDRAASTRAVGHDDGLREGLLLDENLGHGARKEIRAAAGRSVNVELDRARWVGLSVQPDLRDGRRADCGDQVRADAAAIRCFHIDLLGTARPNRPAVGRIIPRAKRRRFETGQGWRSEAYFANPSSVRNTLASWLSRARNFAESACPMERCVQKFSASSFFHSSAWVTRCMRLSQ